VAARSRNRVGLVRRAGGLLSVLLAAQFLFIPGTVTAEHRPRHEKIPVLMYHRIACAPDGHRAPSRWVCPERFDATLALLKESGWDTMTAREVSRRLKRRLPIPDKTFVIVIDDGRYDGYDNAYPILEKYDFEAVFAVVVGRVSVKDVAMTWPQLLELQASGHEIANHSMTHTNLRLADAQLWQEIEESSQVLADMLGRRPKTFVYPYGGWSSAAADQVRRSGFRIAYTVEYGCNLTWGDRFQEERIRINRSDSPQRVLDKIGPCA
jgi:peptidoglycan/xylan/chitin deacetylase (PgdA/CDA1 family)